MNTFESIDFKEIVPIIVIFDSPLDFPSKVVARLFDLGKPTPHYIVGDTLNDVRSRLPHGMVRMSRAEDDEPHIVEVWL